VVSYSSLSTATEYQFFVLSAHLRMRPPNFLHRSNFPVNPVCAFHISPCVLQTQPISFCLSWFQIILLTTSVPWSRDSSVVVATRLLPGWPRIWVRFPVRTKDSSRLHNVLASSGAHPASCALGTGGSFPGVKQQMRGAEHAPSTVCCNGVTLN
jgi:hypothetical protein